MFCTVIYFTGFPGGSEVEDLPTDAGDTGDMGFDPWFGKIPWRRKWQRFPVFLLGKSHEQRNLAGCSLHGIAKSQTSLSMHTHTHMLFIGDNKTVYSAVFLRRHGVHKQNTEPDEECWKESGFDCVVGFSCGWMGSSQEVEGGGSGILVGRKCVSTY